MFSGKLGRVKIISLRAPSLILFLALLSPIGVIADKRVGDPTIANASAQTHALYVPPGATMVLTESAYVFAELELNEGSVIAFSGVKAVQITCVKLTLHGKSTIDLSPSTPSPPRPSEPAPKGQALNNNNPPTTGDTGTTGGTGKPGAHGVSLAFSAQQLSAADGSMWVKMDGGAGGPGGYGGMGGKGSSGPATCVSNPNGGNGGAGGAGGPGGPGGNTGKVTFKIGANTVSPTQAQGTAPSPRPASANMPGVIVISGSPGKGGSGGPGGRGGDAGEGHEGPGGFFCPSTDSQSGGRGADGPTGAKGADGKFIP